MAIEHEEAGALEPGAGGKELGKDVFTGAVLFEHFAEAADLSLNAGETVEELFFFGGIHQLLLVDERYPLGVC